MPNWITNRLEITDKPGQIKRLIKQVAGKTGERSERLPFDFNSIVPMPPELMMIQSGFCTIGGQRFGQWYEMGDDGAPQGITPEMEIAIKKKTGGFKGWYDWSCHNWGTKWNARHLDDTPEYQAGVKHSTVIYRFDTAWAPPIPVLLALSKMYPNAHLELNWEDEGDNDNHDTSIRNGKVTNETSTEKEHDDEED